MPRVLILFHPKETKAAEELHRHCVPVVRQTAGDVVLATTTTDADATLFVVLIESRILAEGDAAVRAAAARGAQGFLPVRLRDVVLPDYLDQLKLLPASGRPVMEARSRDRAWREVAQEIIKAALDRTPAPQASRTPLRSPPRVFVGRRVDLSRCTAHLASGQSVALWGPPGVGKSTLALQALHDAKVAERYGDRRYFVACGPLREGSDLLAHLAQALGMPSGRQPERWIGPAVSAAPHLVVLDGVDAALDGPALNHLLSHANLTLLLTHRRSTQLDVFTQKVAPLNSADSHQLFHTEADRDFTHDPALAAILELTDGIPLAVMLKGREARARSLTAVLERLRKGEQEGPLAAAIQGSIDLLEEDVTNGLCLLAQIPAGMLPGDIQVLRLADSVKKLTDAALVSEEVSTGRVRMLTPVRHHVRGQLKDKLVPEQLRQLRQRYFSQADAQVPDLVNLESLIGDALDVEQLDEEALQAALKLFPFWRFTGLGNPTLLALASSKAAKHERWADAARCLARRADVALERTRYDDARQWYEQAQALYDRAADEAGGAWCRLGLGHICRYRCDAQGALDHYQHALHVYQRRQDNHGLAHVHKSLGHQHLALRSFAEAEDHYEQALRLFQDTQELGEAANCQRSMGLLFVKQRRPAKAEPWLMEARAGLERAGDIRGQADCLHALSVAALRRNQLDEADRWLQEARQHYERIQDPRGIAQSLLLRARLHERRTDRRAAHADYQEALQLATGLSSWRSIADAHDGLARLSDDQVDVARHRKEARHARARIRRPRPAAAAASPPRS